MIPEVTRTRTRDFFVDTSVLRWPISADKMDKREERTLLREKHHIFSSFEELRQETIKHDLWVLRKWLQRGLHRDRALLINPAEVWTAVIAPGVLEYHIVQKAIKYDPDVYAKYKDYEYLMVPRDKSVLTLIFLDDPWMRGS